MTAQRMGSVRGWEQRFDRCPDGIKHFGLECAHDVCDLHLVVGLGRTQNQIWAITTTGGWSPIRAASKAALADGYLSVSKFWSANFMVLIDVLGVRLRRPWTMDQFAMAVIAYSEGCSLRQRTSDHIEMMIRPTGPNGEDQEWSLFAVGLEALVHQFLEPDPEFSPPA